MAVATTRQWESLGEWSPRLFLAAGLLVAGHGAVKAVEAFADVAPPPDVFGPAGYLLAVVGMVGLYPALSDRSPGLARAAVAVAVVPAVGWVVILAFTAGELLGVAAGSTPPGPVLAVHMAGLLATYLLFAVASLRSDVHPNAVGGLLLVPPLLIVGMFVGAAVVGASAVGASLVGTGQALVHLSVGARLPTGPEPADHASPTGEAAAD